MPEGFAIPPHFITFRTSAHVNPAIPGAGNTTLVDTSSTQTITGKSLANMTQVILGSDGYSTTPTDGYMDNRTTTITGHAIALNTTITASSGGFNGVDAQFIQGPVTDQAAGHTSAFQARQHHNPGIGNNIPYWYGLFIRPYLDSGTTGQILGIYQQSYTGAASAVTTQYGFRTNSFTGGTYNIPLAVDGAADADTNRGGAAGSAQADQYSWIGTKLSIGTSAGSADTYQLSVTPQKSTITGRGGITVTGGTWTNSSGAKVGINVTQTVTQTGTAGYTALEILMTETSTGSGTKNLINASVGGSSKFSVANDGTLTVAGTVIHTLSSTPASASAAGVTGTLAWDSSYVYVCVATNTWKRVAIASW